MKRSIASAAAARASAAAFVLAGGLLSPPAAWGLSEAPPRPDLQAPEFAPTGSTVTVSSVDPCPRPDGAAEWYVEVVTSYFYDDAGIIDEYEGEVAGDGSWAVPVRLKHSAGGYGIQATCYADRSEDRYRDPRNVTYDYETIYGTTTGAGYQVLLAEPTTVPCFCADDTGTTVRGFGQADEAYGSPALDGHGPDEVGTAFHSTGLGHWIAASDGGVFTYGLAGFHGSAGDVALAQPIVAIAARPQGDGYWLVGRDGGVLTYGAAGFHGSTGDVRLVSPIVGAAAAPDGNGYWLVASDGGVFAFGSARFHGSLGGVRLNAPIVGMAATPAGDGYRLLGRDGGVFTFGPGASFAGAPAGIGVRTPTVSIASHQAGDGYWVLGEDGGIFSFGDAPFLGSCAGCAPRAGGAQRAISLASVPDTRD